MLPLGVFPYSPGSLEDATSEQSCTPKSLLNQHLGPVTIDPPQEPPGVGVIPTVQINKGTDFQVSATQTSCDFNLSLSPLHMYKNSLLKVHDTILVTYF